MGWLARRHGFASDSVVSFELVTPDGLVVEVSADTHPELFWALSGAGDGSLGVVASIELELHPIGPRVRRPRWSTAPSAPATC